jgi:hypothetical protein
VTDEARRVWNELDARGATATCPICGTQEWQSFDEPANLHVGLPAITPGNEVVYGPSEAGGLAAYALTCQNCGYIRLHARKVLDEPRADS